MPRKVSGRNEAGRERTARYRQRLRSTGTPEASAVDVAVSATVSATAETLRRNGEKARAAVQARRDALRADIARGVLSGQNADDAFAELMLPAPEPEARPLSPGEFVQRVLQGSIDFLVNHDCHPANPLIRGAWSSVVWAGAAPPRSWTT